MSLYKTTFILIFLIIIIAAGVNFYYPERVSNVLIAIAGKETQNPEETKCPEAVPVFCEAPASQSKETSSLLETAAKSCRIFGSFTIGNFSNIEQIMPNLSAEYRAKMTNWTESQKNNILPNNDFDSIITNPVEGKTIFSDEKNGQIMILTNRTKVKENINKEPAKENCLIDFRKNDASWEIENIIFSKAE